MILGPEVEKRVADYQAKNGGVLFGGHLHSDINPNLVGSLSHA